MCYEFYPFRSGFVFTAISQKYYIQKHSTSEEIFLSNKNVPTFKTRYVTQIRYTDKDELFETGSETVTDRTHLLLLVVDVCTYQEPRGSRQCSGAD